MKPQKPGFNIFFSCFVANDTLNSMRAEKGERGPRGKKGKQGLQGPPGPPGRVVQGDIGVPGYPVSLLKLFVLSFKKKVSS